MEKQRSFEFSGCCYGRVPHNVRKCIIYLSQKKTNKKAYFISPASSRDYTTVEFSIFIFVFLILTKICCKIFMVIFRKLSKIQTIFHGLVMEDNLPALRLPKLAWHTSTNSHIRFRPCLQLENSLEYLYVCLIGAIFLTNCQS